MATDLSRYHRHQDGYRYPQKRCLSALRPMVLLFLCLLVPYHASIASSTIDAPSVSNRSARSLLRKSKQHRELEQSANIFDREKKSPPLRTAVVPTATSSIHCRMTFSFTMMQESILAQDDVKEEELQETVPGAASGLETTTSFHQMQRRKRNRAKTDAANPPSTVMMKSTTTEPVVSCIVQNEHKYDTDAILEIVNLPQPFLQHHVSLIRSGSMYATITSNKTSSMEGDSDACFTIQGSTLVLLPSASIVPYNLFPDRPEHLPSIKEHSSSRVGGPQESATTINQLSPATTTRTPGVERREAESWTPSPGAVTMGTKTVAIVRVSTLDSAPTATREDLLQLMDPFGINFRTQYDKCSFGQLQWTLAETGFIDVTIPNYINSFPSGSTLVAAAQDLIIQQGLMPAPDFQSWADRVLFCLAPGTGDWAASAGVNHWRAQFNNDWCLSLSANMHEVGHTIGLIQ
jgi:hypothetical protein